MSVNSELAEIFREMAALLELTGANAFRVNASARVARALDDLTEDIADMAGDPKRIRMIEGIGESSARKIVSWLETHTIKAYDDLLLETPRGLLEVLKIPGLGPKTVRTLWEQAGVTDLTSLKAKLDAGELEDLPRLGARSVENIRESLAFLATRAGRTRLGTALPVAEVIVERLRRLEGAGGVEYAGSLRRGCETIGDIDILATSADPAAMSGAFQSLPGVIKVLVAGHTKSSIRLEEGLQVDLRIVDEQAYGAALMYFTGSKEHNVLLRERAVKRGLRLNEYGLYTDDGVEEPPRNRGVTPIAGRSEEEVYAALEMPWIPPELREHRGELELAEVPRLIEISDIRAELHAHTVASDGRLTIDELAEAARDRGYHTIAVTDHSRSSAQANGLSVERLHAHVVAVREANERHEDITILAGSEVDILADGRLDYDDEDLQLLDIVVASPHSSLRQETKAATRRLIAAASHPLVNIIGHPTGRVINRRAGLDLDLPALFETAREHNTALEINANFMRLDLRDIHVKSAVEAGVLIAVNTDAHGPNDFDHLRYGVMTARRGWLEASGCLNCWTANKLHAWLRSAR